MVTRSLNPWVGERFQHLHTVERKRIAPPATSEPILRLNRGEQPVGWPNQVISEVWDTYRADLMHQYPNYIPIYEKLAQYTGYPVEQIVVGQGIEEFIKTLPLICCDVGDSWAVTWPTCAMYEIYAKAWNLELVKIQTYFGRTTLVSDVLSALKPNTKLVMLPNPGQPVETYFGPANVEFLARECAQRGILLAMDEAHFGFGAETALKLVKYYENLIVLRTFSKLYGGASLRVGYAVASSMMAKALHAVRESGEISGPSMHAAIELLSMMSTIDKRRRDVREGADWLRDEINRCNLGIRAKGERGFSLLIECDTEERKKEIVLNLLASRVYVKSDFDVPLNRCFLLTCGSKTIMETFYGLLLPAVKKSKAA